MVMDSKHIQTTPFTRVTSKKGLFMALVEVLPAKVRFTRVILLLMSWKAKDCSNGLMEKSTMEISKLVNAQERVCTCGQMDSTMKASSNLTSAMATVFSTTQMVKSMTDRGRMERSTEKENTSGQMELAISYSIMTASSRKEVNLQILRCHLINLNVTTLLLQRNLMELKEH
jgi:hypothetical protein